MGVGGVRVLGVGLVALAGVRVCRGGGAGGGGRSTFSLLGRLGVQHGFDVTGRRLVGMYEDSHGGGVDYDVGIVVRGSRRPLGGGVSHVVLRGCGGGEGVGGRRRRNAVRVGSGVLGRGRGEAEHRVGDGGYRGVVRGLGGSVLSRGLDGVEGRAPGRGGGGGRGRVAVLGVGELLAVGAPYPGVQGAVVAEVGPAHLPRRRCNRQHTPVTAETPQQAARGRALSLTYPLEQLAADTGGTDF